MDTALAAYDFGTDALAPGRALAALENANTFEELTELRQQTQQLVEHCRAWRLSLSRQNDAAEIKLRTERKLGALLHSTAALDRRLRDESTGRMLGAERTLPEGINHNQSHRWQRMADLPDDKFIEWMTRTRAAGEELTQAGLLRVARAYRQEQELALPLNGCDEDDEDVEGDDPDEADAEGGSQEVRLLIPTRQQFKVFRRQCRTLQSQYGTSSTTTTVVEAVRRAIEEAE